MRWPVARGALDDRWQAGDRVGQTATQMRMLRQPFLADNQALHVVQAVLPE